MGPQNPVPSLSTFESNRFNLDVHRFRFEKLDHTAMSAVLTARPDVAIVRIPANELHKINQLPMGRLDSLVADTLVHYSAATRTVSPIQRKNVHLEFRQGRPDDCGALADLVRKAFKGYVNHYLANRLFSSADVLDGFVEWGTGFVSNLDDRNPGDRKLWVVTEADRLVAFAGCRSNGSTLEIVLNGVDPGQKHRGIYGDLISHILDEARAEFDNVSISTQVHNIAVQRVWQTRGFRLVAAENTVHFNLFLSGRHHAKIASDFCSESEFAAAWNKLGVSEMPSSQHFYRRCSSADTDLKKPGAGRLVLIDNSTFRQVRVELANGAPLAWMNWLQK